MSESTKNLLNINHLSDKLCNLENFLDFKWDNYAVPIIDVDFFDLFSRCPSELGDAAENESKIRSPTHRDPHRPRGACGFL